MKRGYDKQIIWKDGDEFECCRGAFYRAVCSITLSLLFQTGHRICGVYGLHGAGAVGAGQAGAHSLRILRTTVPSSTFCLYIAQSTADKPPAPTPCFSA